VHKPRFSRRRRRVCGQVGWHESCSPWKQKGGLRASVASERRSTFRTSTAGLRIETENMIRHILCPADFSRSSQRALHFAADLASRRGATVTLLHVLDPSAPEHAGSSLSCDRLQDLQRRAQRAVARLTDRAIEIELAIGAAYDVILNRAQRPAVDLVVMSLGSRSGIGDLLRGSLTERILSHVSVPVLVVPNSTPWESEDAPVPRTIVMAIDFSSVTEAVIQAAKEQSELWRARLVALHVVPPPRDASSSKEDTNSKEDTYWLSARPMGRPRAVREGRRRGGVVGGRRKAARRDPSRRTGSRRGNGGPRRSLPSQPALWLDRIDLPSAGPSRPLSHPGRQGAINRETEPSRYGSFPPPGLFAPGALRSRGRHGQGNGYPSSSVQRKGVKPASVTSSCTFDSGKRQRAAGGRRPLAPHATLTHALRPRGEWRSSKSWDRQSRGRSSRPPRSRG
jgi:nucleotide-binding universal stress UspA family protein